MIVTCPLGFWTGEASDVNSVCGCHVRSRCGGCGVCTSCDGCYCSEDDAEYGVRPLASWSGPGGAYPGSFGWED